MKKLLPFLSVLLLVPVLILPVLGAELAGGYYVTGDSTMGNDLTFYVPSDYAVGCLTYDESGYLFNLTSSSIYLYCPDYPEYTIYAPRFSGFQWRSGSGSSYNYSDLNLKNITAGNVEILEDSPSMALSYNMLLVLILAVIVIIAGMMILLPRR